MQEPADISLHHAASDVHFAPVRHHSPACAAFLRLMMRDVRPAQVLIEAPTSFEPLIPLLLDPALRPPVAMLALADRAAKGTLEAAPRPGGYYPITAHSPEFVALREASALDARIGFIDLSWSQRQDAPDAHAAASLLDETAFSVSDFTRALCRKTGCRDQNELWDQLFEQRLGGDDWRAFFTAVGAYCAAVREGVGEADLARDGTHARETHMAALLHAARARQAGPILVVTGGLHTPALIAALDRPAPAALSPAAAAAGERSFVVRYGERELDRLNGYAAGLPLPAYYRRLWQAYEAGARGGELWRGLTLDLLAGFSDEMRHIRPTLAPTLPSLTDAGEAAIRLALLRGRAGPLRTDLLDAAASSFVKGELAAGSAPVLGELTRFLAGAELGDIPLSAGSPPLVEDARSRALKHGVAITTGLPRNMALDIHRKPQHGEASRFFRAMTYLETGLARRVSRPDFMRAARDDDRLIENWTLAWSPRVEARLIEHAGDGDTVPAACLARLKRQAVELSEAGYGNTARTAIRLLVTACEIGLAERADDFLPLIERELSGESDFVALAFALSELFLVYKARASLGMLDHPGLKPLLDLAYRRAVYLLDDLPNLPEDAQRPALQGLAQLHEVLGSLDEVGEASALDPALFHGAIEALLHSPLPGVLAGAVHAIAFIAGRCDGERLRLMLRAHLCGAFDLAQQKVAALAGIMAISPELVWHQAALLAELDDAIGRFSGDEFMAALPDLRLAFAALDPRQTDLLAEALGDRHGKATSLLRQGSPVALAEADLFANLRLDARLRETLIEDGLAGFITSSGEAP